MVEKYKFMDKIYFNLTFKEVFYIDNYRKVCLFMEYGEGYIIGQTVKKEGICHSGSKPSSPFFDDGDPPYFECKETIPFWKVAVGFNKIVLVPKRSDHGRKIQKIT
jgi:hypothetical protein